MADQLDDITDGIPDDVDNYVGPGAESPEFYESGDSTNWNQELITGCMDHNATNYDPYAVNDDGSCEYDISTTQEGINWLYGTKVLLCRDPLTKEEVLMGVCDQPEIQSEIFIERGKQSVMEPNLRLGEINTMGGLINHGYKYFRIKKQ